MYLQTSRLQYNLQKVGVFQTAHSDKNIQAEACRYIIPQKCEQFKQKHIFEPQKRVGQLDFKTAFAELCGFELQYDKEKQPPPVMVTGGLDKLEKLWYNHAPNINGNTFP